MPMTRRSLVKLAAAAPFFATRPVPGAQLAANDSLRSEIRRSAGLLGLPGFVAGVVRDGKHLRNRQPGRGTVFLLGLPGFVAGVVRDGKLSLVQADGFADLE